MHFDKPTYTVRRTRKKDIPKGLYTKDPATGDIIFNKEIEDNQMVSPKSGHHFPIGARQRIAALRMRVRHQYVAAVTQPHPAEL